MQTATFDAQFGQTQGGVTNISIKIRHQRLPRHRELLLPAPQFLGQRFLPEQGRHAAAGLPVQPLGRLLQRPGAHPESLQRQEQDLLPVRLRGHSRFAPAPRRHHQHRPHARHAQGRFLGPPRGRRQLHHLRPRDAHRPDSAGRFTETPFPGNIIPTNRFDKVGAAIMGYYPTTEKSQGDITGLGNYQDASTAEKAKYWNGTWRVDQNLGERQRFFVRYSTYTRNSTYNNYFDNAFVGTQFWFYSKTAVFDHVYTLSPTVVLNSRYSYNRFIRGVGSTRLSRRLRPRFTRPLASSTSARSPKTRSASRASTSPATSATAPPTRTGPP